MKGVTKTTLKKKPWVARLKVDNVLYHIGNFETEELAVKEYSKNFKEWHGHNPDGDEMDRVSGERYHDYIISRCGKCYSILKRKFVKPILNKQGYLQFNLFINGEYFKTGVHRVLAIVYIPNPENKAQVNHKDGDKTNNSLDNLEWMTASENIRDMHERKRARQFLAKYRGEK